MPIAPVMTTENPFERTSDYGMTDFTMTIMNEQGEPERVIKGKKMAHFPEDDSTHISEPIAEFVNHQNDTWIVNADKGTTHGKGHEILLEQNVIVYQQDSKNTQMHTSILTLNTDNSTAYTDAPVKMISPYGETNSVGLHATLDDKTINLHSRVKGQYDASATQ